MRLVFGASFLEPGIILDQIIVAIRQAQPALTDIDRIEFVILQILFDAHADRHVNAHAVGHAEGCGQVVRGINGCDFGEMRLDRVDPAPSRSLLRP